MTIVRERLEGPGFRLVPFDVSQISERYVSWLQDPEVTRFLEVRHEPQSWETAAAFVKSFEGPAEKYIWAIIPRGSEEPIGTCTLHDIDRHNGSAAFGLMIGDKRFWGSRASEEAIALIADFAFGRLKLRRLTGATCVENRGMNFTFRKTGFTLEGRMRESMRFGDTYVDAVRWGLLAHEWRQRKRDHDPAAPAGQQPR